MVRYRARPRSRAQLRASYQRGKNLAYRILQGLVLIGIGVAFIAANAGIAYHEVTGHIENEYTHTTDGGQYDATYLQISSDPNDLYIFDKTTLHPAWSDHVYLHARVDIYYKDDTPRRVGAIQMYDPFGSPTTKYTTTNYTDSLHASPVGNVGLDIGVIVTLLGALWIAAEVLNLVKTQRQRRTATATAAYPSGSATSTNSYQAQPYKSPSASYPDQGKSDFNS